MNEQERAICLWVFNTCLTFGTAVKTAGAVAGHFEDAFESGEIGCPRPDPVASPEEGE